MPNPINNWFDPRNRGPASEYGDLMPESAPAAPQGMPVATGDHATLRNRRLADALAEQPITQHPGMAQPQPSVMDSLRGGLAQGGEQAQAHAQLMEMERERQRQQAVKMAAELVKMYQMLQMGQKKPAKKR